MDKFDVLLLKITYVLPNQPGLGALRNNDRKTGEWIIGYAQQFILEAKEMKQVPEHLQLIKLQNFNLLPCFVIFSRHHFLQIKCEF
jgi:hypothetical protein